MKTADELLLEKAQVYTEDFDYEEMVGKDEVLDSRETITYIMIEFAKMHVEAALKAASNQNNYPDSFLESNTWWIPSDSILNAYSKELIK